jgi:hypothetical protein
LKTETQIDEKTASILRRHQQSQKKQQQDEGLGSERTFATNPQNPQAGAHWGPLWG